MAPKLAEFVVWCERESVKQNYKNKCKTTTYGSITRKGYSAMRGCDRGFGEVRELTQSPSLLSLSSLISGLFLTCGLYLNHTKQLKKYKIYHALILKSFEHATAFLKYLAPTNLLSANIPKLQFLYYIFKAFTTYDVNINHLIMLVSANSSTW